MLREARVLRVPVALLLKSSPSTELRAVVPELPPTARTTLLKVTVQWPNLAVERLGPGSH